jgi:riboflavin kinase
MSTPRLETQEPRPLKIIFLRGKVCTGTGEGAEFLRLRWVRDQVKEKLGFLPWPGTLNIRLDVESVERKKALTKGLLILPEKNHCCGRLFKAVLEDVECALLAPEVAGYAEDLIEIIAKANLRKGLRLADGDSVRVKVMF